MKKTFDYKQVGKEIGWNFSKMKSTSEAKTDFDFWQTVVANLNENAVMLDLGCGSAEKTIKHCQSAKEIYLTDIEDEMLVKAQANVDALDEGLKQRFKLKKIDMNGNLPFEDEQFDLVIARHSGEATKEVFRILKTGGIFVSEDIAKDDCSKLKTMFSRGQGYFEEDKRPEILKTYFELGFSKISYYKIEIDEFYASKADLVYLLTHTPILDYYDKVEDNKILEKYISNHQTDKGILLKRHLYAFIIKK